MPVLPEASIPCSLHDIDAFLLSDDSNKQKEQLKLPARVYCFALSQLLIHHLQHRIGPPKSQEHPYLKIINPANSLRYDKNIRQSAKFYWGEVDKKLCIAKWVLSVEFNPAKDFKDQTCTLENWTVYCHPSKEGLFNVFGHKRSLEIGRFLYILQHPAVDLDKFFHVLEPAEKLVTRFNDVAQGSEPWTSEWMKEREDSYCAN